MNIGFIAEENLVLPGEELVGGWAEVYVEGFDKPVKSAVSLEEYIGRKKDGSVAADCGAGRFFGAE